MNRTTIDHWLHAAYLHMPGLLSMLGLLVVVWLMLQPVELSFSQADLRLIYTALPLCVLGVMLVLVRGITFRVTSADYVLGAWAAYIVLRCWFSADYPCFISLSRVVGLAALYVSLRLLFSAARTTSTAVEAALMLFACLECLLCVWQVLSGSSRHADYLITGTFLNPGPCSAVLLVGATLGLSRCRSVVSSQNSCFQRFFRIFSLLTLLLCLLLFPLGWSRTALVAGVACMLLVLWPRLTVRVRVIAVVALLALLLSAYFIKRGSANGRALFYIVSLSSIAKHPFMGSGIGSFFHEYSVQTQALHTMLPESIVRYSDTIEYALSDILLVGIEQGMVGLTLCFTALFTVLWRLGRLSKPLALVLLSLLFCSIFSYPFQLLPFQLLFVVLSAYSGCAGAALTDHGRAGCMHVPVIVAVCVVAVVPPLLLYHPLRARVLATQTSMLVVGRNNPHFIGEYHQLHPLLRGDARFLFRYGQLLASMGRYNESNAVLREGTRVSNDAMFHVLRGNNYVSLHAYDKAERAYRLAHAQGPRRMYPLYRLMLLYEQTGDRQRACDVARRLLDMPQRVPSALTDSIRSEAKECLGRQ